MKTKYYLLALACLFACAVQTRAQYIWSNQLYAPESGTTHVTDQPNIFSINAVTCVQDVDFDSVIDNLESSLEEHGIGWVSTDGYAYLSDDTYTIYFAISQNYGQPRSVCFGTESSYHEVIQNPYSPPIPVDFDKNWMVNVTFNDSGLSSATPFYDISYLDGLGYETHTIQLGASTSGASIVTPHSFDAFKRETDKWLPFPAETEGEAIENSSYEQRIWYDENFGSDDSMCTSYSDVMESAPSGRKTHSYIPGYDMVENAADYRYVTNSSSDAVLHFTANQFTGELSCSGYYPSGVLRGEVFNDGDGRETITWTDGEGKVIRVDNIMSPAQRASTVYVYDSRGNQCWVISPEGSLRIGQECGAAISGGGTYTLLPSSETASEWCYVYKRDSRNRVTEKHIPGRGAEYYTYDALDRVISCSDPLLRSHGRHILYEYDALGRETSRFMENSSQTDRVTLIETWYDTSSGSVFPVADSVYVQGTAIANPKGLKTRERVAMIDGTVVSSAVSYLERYYWYDSSGRVAQCYEEFPDGETLRTSYRYGIQGNVLKTMQTCTKDNTSVWTVSTYRYDHRGRLASVSRSFSETSHLDDITYGYDVLGHPASRSCGGKISETQTYDIRGWNECLTASRGSNVMFGETLRYSSPESSQSEGQHNGNITEITSSHYGMAQETVSYFYDNLNRLRDAKHYTGSLSNPDNNYTERNITYDRNGNVLSMTRSQTSPQNITMTYDGNRLSSYCDSEQFTYDSNGNCCYDPTTGLEYSYNFLNLPCTVFDGEEMQLQYTYFADGTKYSVMRDFNEGYLYVGPFVYKIHPDYDYPFLESVSSEEGRLVCDESSHIWRDCWFTKDHIGNVRTVLDLSKSASAPLSDIIVEQDSYLPFGTKSANPALFGSDNRYRLCGNEEQRLNNFTTTLTDFGARSYNPTICRWMMIDPMAEKYYSLAPYVYCHNTPIVFIDPNGCADINWKLVLSGTSQLASGSAMAITGASICVSTDGIAAPLGGAAMITAGLGTASIGLANITAGIKGVENLPLPDTMTGTVGMAIDETINSIEGTDNHIFENVGNAAEFTVGFIPPFTTSLSKAMKGIQTFTSTYGNIGTVTETGINVYYTTQEYYTKYIFHDDNIDEQDDSKTN